jgi:hypothetical protein
MTGTAYVEGIVPYNLDSCTFLDFCDCWLVCGKTSPSFLRMDRQ